MRKLIAPTLLSLLIAVPGAQAATKLTIRGAGFGHGIGMSQFGAYGYALHLTDYPTILGHYYTGTALSQLSANPDVGVLLQDGRPSVRFTGALSAGELDLDQAETYSVAQGAGGLVIRDAAGAEIATTAGPLRVAAPVGGAVELLGVSTPGVRDGRYRDALVLSASGSRMRAVNVLGLEDYVRGVVSGESPASWPTEALRAQAVAARTYAITSNAGGATFTQYADTRSQVYRGVSGETPTTDAAVRDTAGQVVTYNGTPATTFFFSTSGGETEDIENSFVGSAPKPWLKAVEDPFDNLSPKHRWGPFKYTAAQAGRKLGRLLKGRFTKIKVLQRGASPRVVRAQVVGTKGIVNVTGPQLRRVFGLFDTWAYFTSVATAVKTPASTPAPAPPTGGTETGGGMPAARAAGAGSS
ncbi:MAG: SpoIID/LytB domain-containing protein, partial [Actinomycetota bacterium]|nr:SpoIID/LytB domain-containing protein [Actinomycetota bacterium]